MDNFIYSFNNWSHINENRDEEILKKINDLSFLAELGIIPKRDIMQFLYDEGADAMLQNDPSMKNFINSPEYSELKALGLEVVSSRTQLRNGNIILGYSGYSPKNSFGIGLFLDGKLIRRMTPKGIPLGIQWRKLGSMDYQIKKLTSVNTEDFYVIAARWILDHIDFEKSTNSHNLPDFPVKQRTRRDYFDKF